MFSGALLIAIYAIQCFQYLDGLRIHIVSWNVADNKRMSGDLPKHSLSKLLSSDTAADIFAVSLQENCFECDNDDMDKISDLIKDQLKSLYNIDYVFNGVEMTRDNGHCELIACKITGLHGTTLMMVFSRPGITKGARSDRFKVNDCQKPILGLANSEKGIAAVKITLMNGDNLCFAGAHLDSDSPQERQKCVRRFFTETNEWTDCHKFYLMGDFNARTAENSDENEKHGVNLSDEKLQQLIVKDEMNGEEPYGGTALLNSISALSGWKFEEPLRPIIDVPTFMPTYSVLESEKYCGGQKPCYREARSPAWTDRIVCHNCGEVVKYTSEVALSDYSDHLPVIGIYTTE